mgnify:FL=1
MKNSLINLKNGNSFYILEDTTYNNKNYALAVSINENDTNKMNVVVMEYYFENGQIMVSEIADDNIAKTVTELLQQKLQNNE